MRRYIPLIGLFLVGMLWSCGNTPEDTAPPAAPETVVKQYQHYIDKNQFGKAKAISTPEERQRLEELERILSQEAEASTIMTTQFLEIDCFTERDTARCYCLVEDEYERYATEFVLVRRGGRWLVDAPEGPAARMARVPPGSPKSLSIEHPTGEFTVIATLDGEGQVASAGVLRTARKLCDGVVFG